MSYGVLGGSADCANSNWGNGVVEYFGLASGFGREIFPDGPPLVNFLPLLSIKTGEPVETRPPCLAIAHGNIRDILPGAGATEMGLLLEAMTML